MKKQSGLDDGVIIAILAIMVSVLMVVVLVVAIRTQPEDEHKPLDITALCQGDFDVIESWYDADGNRTLLAQDKKSGIRYLIDNNNITVLYDKDGHFLKEEK